MALRKYWGRSPVPGAHQEVMMRFKRFCLYTLGWFLALLGLISFVSAQSEKQKATDLLINAIRNRDWREIDTALKAGADLNVQDRDGITPLTEAIEDNLSALARKLVLAGADPNMPSSDGSTPLLHAAWMCDTKLARFLLRRGSRINDQAQHDGSTALINASYSCKDARLVRLLLKAGANVNLKDIDGETALHVAAFSGNEDAVRELVRAGVDVALKNEDGETALSIAKDRVTGRKPSHDRIVLFLAQYSKQGPHVKTLLGSK